MNYKILNQLEFEDIVKTTKLLIVTATEVEKLAMLKYLKPLNGDTKISAYTLKNQTYYFGSFGLFNAVYVQCGDMGSAGRESSAMTVKDAIRYCEPKIVVMPGIAFGIDKTKQKIGEVLVSERVVYYEPQRASKKSIQYRGKEGPANLQLVNRFRNVLNWNHTIRGITPLVNVGMVLSGEKLVDNPALVAKLIKEYPSAIGGEMEGAGLYAASDSEGIPWILAKAICDYGDGNKAVHKKARQAVAANSAVNLCHHIFSMDRSFIEMGLIEAGNSATLNVPALMAKQVQAQIKKQMNSGKYIPKTFIEIGSTKEHFRRFCFPTLFTRKFLSELQNLDFRNLNKVLISGNLPPFSFDISPCLNKYKDVRIDNLPKFNSGVTSFLIEKEKELESLESISSNDTWPFTRKLKDYIKAARFLSSKVGVIKEAAGQGKTNFLCDLCDNFILKHSIPSIFLTGAEIIPDNIRLTILKKIFPNKLDTDLDYEKFLVPVKSLVKKKINCL